MELFGVESTWVARGGWPIRLTHARETRFERRPTCCPGPTGPNPAMRWSPKPERAGPTLPPQEATQTTTQSNEAKLRLGPGPQTTNLGRPGPQTTTHAKPRLGTGPQTTNLARPQTTNLVRPQTTNLVRPQTTNLVRPQTTNLVRPQTTNLVRPQTTNLARPRRVPLPISRSHLWKTSRAVGFLFTFGATFTLTVSPARALP